MGAPSEPARAEIERKFLVRDIEFLRGVTGTEVLQGYLSADEGRELRVRITEAGSTLTFKGRRIGNARLEWEVGVPAEVAESLLALAGPRVIRKRRYPVVGPDGHLWIVDVFDGPLAGLVLAEVELAQPNEVVEMPSWVSTEVTNDENFYNRRLAQTAEPPTNGQ